MIRSHRGVHPRIDVTAFLAENAIVIGDVEIGEDASVWYGVVLRGDCSGIRIGRATNVQDGTVVHGVEGRAATVLEPWVTVGHQVTLHGCHVRQRSLIGMGTVVLDGAVIGEESVVGAGSLVPAGMRVEPRTLVLGTPARFARRLDDDDVEWVLEHARAYLRYKAAYLAEGAGQLVPQANRRQARGQLT